MSPYAGTRQDVHYERKRAWAEEFFASDECIRQNNGLLSELGSNHLLGSGFGKGYTVRDVKIKAAASLGYWLVGDGCVI